MKNKKNRAVILMISVFIHLMCITMPSVIAKAADITDTFLFINEITLTDENGNALGNDVSKKSEVHINYKFSIPNEFKVNEGDVYKMKIPKQIQIIKEFDFDLKAEGTDEAVAKVHIDKSGNVVITFTNYASNHSNVSGYFFVDSYFDENNIGNTNPEKITFNIGGNATKTINVNFHQKPVKPSTYIKKSGKYDYAKNEITWEVVVNPDKVSINDVQVIDNIPVGQEYVEGSATIDNGANINGFEYHKAVSADLEKTGTLIYNFGESINQTYRLTFKTKVSGDNVFDTEDATITQSNIAVLNHDGVTNSSNNASVNIVTDFINKKGSYNQHTNKIDWVITINNNSREIEEAKVIDKIPNGLTLTNGSVKVDNVNIMETDYGYVNNVFEYKFPNTIREVHTISFSTDITDSDAFTSNNAKSYYNVAELKGLKGVPNNATATAGVYVPTNVIQKYGRGYNQATGEITWEIVVNNNKTNLVNPVITDNIPIGQVYVDGSATRDNGGDSTGFKYISANVDDKDKTGTLTYEFNRAINSRYIINFKTKVTDINVFAVNANKTYYNKVILTGDNIIPSSSEGTQNVISEVLNKWGMNYNYSTREITWSILVNRNEMPMKNAKVIDKINPGQDFVMESVTINGATADSKDYNYDIDSKTFTYIFPENINSANVISFKTKIADLKIFEASGKKVLTNTATLVRDDSIPTVEATGTITVENTVVSKISDYADGNSYIDWNVTMNSNKLPLKDVSITDTLQAGLSLDTTSVRLYKMIVNENGSLSRGEEIKLGVDNVKYDQNTRVFTFNFINDIEDAYLLTFRTDVVDKTKSPFTNSVYFNGEGIKQTSNTRPVYVRFQVAGGGSIGETGAITVVKVDDKTDQKLEGAIFELLDKFQNVIKTSEPTGKDGQVIFNGLKFDLDYYVREKIAPLGYSLSNEIYKFQVKNTKDEKNIEYTFNNSKIWGGIELKKVDDSNRPLKGAEFAIYKESDINFENPLASQLSDSNGIVLFNNIGYGSYKIKEIKEPIGYLNSQQIITAKVTKSGEIVKTTPYNISNKRIMGNIELYKVSEDNEPLKGAEFKLYKKEDSNFQNPLDTQISDELGLVSFKNVEYGEYKIKETKAPEGYSLSNKEITASVVKDDITVETNPYKIINSKIISGGGTPSDPKNPGTPSDSKDPGTSSDSKDPGTPSDPKDPGTSSDSKDPGTPSDPKDPGTSSDSKDPGTPSDPKDPGTSIDPLDLVTQIDLNDSSNTGKVVENVKNSDYTIDNKTNYNDKKDIKLPQTGSLVGSKEISILGLLLIVLGIKLIVRKKVV